MDKRFERRSTFVNLWHNLGQKKATEPFTDLSGDMDSMDDDEDDRSHARSQFYHRHESTTDSSAAKVEKTTQPRALVQLGKRKPSSPSLPLLKRFFVVEKDGVIDPHSRQVVFWNLAMMFAVLYLMILGPYRGATIKSSDTSLILIVLDLIVSLMSMYDVYLRFHLGFDRNSEIIMNKKQIVRMYMRGWFWIDCTAAIPVELLVPILQAELIQILFFVQTIKGFRLRKLESTFTGDWLHLNRGLRNLAMLFVAVPLLAHMLGCGWILVYEDDPTPIPVTQYVKGLYWSASTISTMGFGDIVGDGELEYFYSIITCIIGSASGGFIIAYISSVLDDLNLTQNLVSQKMSSLRSYLAFRKVPRPLQRKILRYYRQFYTKRALFDEASIINTLSIDLASELSMFLLQETLQNIDIFRGIEDSTLTAKLLRVLKPTSFTVGQEIIHTGDAATEMFFLIRGEVVVSTDDNIILAYMGTGNHFGELSLPHHLATVKAVSNCDVFALGKKELHEIMKQFPIIQQRLKASTKRKRTIYQNLRMQQKAQKLTMEQENIEQVSEFLDTDNDDQVVALSSKRQNNKHLFVKTHTQALQLFSIDASSFLEDPVVRKLYIRAKENGIIINKLQAVLKNELT